MGLDRTEIGDYAVLQSQRAEAESRADQAESRADQADGEDSSTRGRAEATAPVKAEDLSSRRRAPRS